MKREYDRWLLVLHHVLYTVTVKCRQERSCDRLDILRMNPMTLKLHHHVLYLPSF